MRRVHDRRVESDEEEDDREATTWASRELERGTAS